MSNPMPIAQFNRFDIWISEHDAKIGSHHGKCDDDIAFLRSLKRIQEQLNHIPADDLRAELKEYAAWDDEELADHNANLSRILWLACGDINEDKAPLSIED